MREIGAMGFPLFPTGFESRDPNWTGVRIPAEADQHSCLIPITIPA
jgi:hypothetical protein